MTIESQPHKDGSPWGRAGGAKEALPAGGMAEVEDQEGKVYHTADDILRKWLTDRWHRPSASDDFKSATKPI